MKLTKVISISLALCLVFLMVPQKANAQHDLVVGGNLGAMIPVGGNIKDNWGMGLPFSAHAKVPGLMEFSGMRLDAGLEFGFYMASADLAADDLSGIPIFAFADLDMSNMLPLPAEMSLAAELGVGLHMQSRGDESFTYLGLTPAAVVGYNVMEGLDVIVKLKPMEILSSDEDFGGTQEWFGFTVGVNYTLPGVLPF